MTWGGRRGVTVGAEHRRAQSAVRVVRSPLAGPVDVDLACGYAGTMRPPGPVAGPAGRSAAEVAPRIRGRPAGRRFRPRRSVGNGVLDRPTTPAHAHACDLPVAKALAAFVVLSLVAACGAAPPRARTEAAAAPIPDAELRVPAPLGLGRVLVSDDESYLVGFTFGGGQSRGPSVVLKYSLTGQVLMRRELFADTSAIGPRDEVLALTSGNARVFSGADFADVGAPVRGSADFADLLRVVAAKGGTADWIALRSVTPDRCEIVSVASRPLRVVSEVAVACELPSAWCVADGSATILAMLDHEFLGISATTGIVEWRLRHEMGSPGFDAAGADGHAWFSSDAGDGCFIQVTLGSSPRAERLCTGAAGRTTLGLGGRGRYLGVVASSWDKADRRADAVAILYAVSESGIAEVGRTAFDVAGDSVQYVAVVESQPAIVVSLGRAGGRVVDFSKPR